MSSTPAAAGNFSTTTNKEGDALVVQLIGDADMSAVELVGATLSETHATARKLKVQRVVLDFRQLGFMNSSCFKKFVTWIHEVEQEPAADQYRILFVANPKTHWQRRSLGALQCFATDLITIET